MSRGCYGHFSFAGPLDPAGGLWNAVSFPNGEYGATTQPPTILVHVEDTGTMLLAINKVSLMLLSLQSIEYHVQISAK